MTKKSFSLQDPVLKRKVGRKIREIRKNKGIRSSKRLAEIIGVHKDQMSRYETGKTLPGPDIVKRIAEFCGKPIDFFYKVSEQETPYVAGRPEEALFDDVKEILESGDADIVNALMANIKAFLGATKAIREKRKCYRFSINIPIDVKILDEPESHSGIVINASQMGLLIQSSQDMAEGKEIDLNISFAKNTEIKSFNAKGQIVRKKSLRLDDATAFQYAIKLIEVSDRGHAKLESLFKESN